MLCSNDNRGIGYLAESPERLRRAALYLEAWAERHAAEPERWPIYSKRGRRPASWVKIAV